MSAHHSVHWHPASLIPRSPAAAHKVLVLVLATAFGLLLIVAEPVVRLDLEAVVQNVVDMCRILVGTIPIAGSW